ncbi:O-succinylbenzoate--CoA ligase [Rhodococcus rhodochrous KG-21]|uniref:O-succinylbenzoate--CoA ligase n=1 Tax=Rhodococcus rhodochrous KG-21 TaxID=1441923 RepID=A0A0M9WN71_RHORH|nr:O-succinylbenzoate--CoA ligase [Rhodococcus rhodochrous KG-21]
MLRSSTQRWPDRIGLRFKDSHWSYAQLDALVDSAAAEYQRRGVGPGDRVVLLMTNRPEYLIAQFAVSRIGAAFTTPNPYWTDAELEPAIAAVAPTAAVVEDPYTALVGESRRLPIPSLHVPTDRATPNEPDVTPTTPMYLPFSSGTTGLPKAVVHSAGSLCGGVAQLVTHLDLSESDRLQLALPLCHIFGAVMCGAGIAAGAEMTLFERFDLTTCLDHVERERVTILPIAGTVAYQLAQLEDLEQRDLSSLRMFMWGGSAVPVSLARDITARTQVDFLCSYGMTEAISVAFNPVENRAEWSLESPGFPTAGTQWRLAGEPGALEGELEIRGASVALGYANAPTDAWLPDGWFRTGDIARIHPDGRLQIIDRLKDMLKVSGFQVSPVEVEQTLIAHPLVRDCGVFGVPDPRSNECPVAVVVPASADLTPDMLSDWVAERLAGYKRPRRFVLTDELPRAASGKLLRRELSARHNS